MIRLDLLRPPLDRDLARLVHNHAEEELQCFRCSCWSLVAVVVYVQFQVEAYEFRIREHVRTQSEWRRTYDDRRRLRDLPDLLVLLHNPLNAGLVRSYMSYVTESRVARRKQQSARPL